MPIKLIALDIDGTLLTARGELTARNLAAILEAQRRGVHVVLVTGRRFDSAYKLLQQLALDVDLVSHNGALTKDLATLETLALHPLPLPLAQGIVAKGRSLGADMICCSDDKIGPGRMVIDHISPTNVSLQRYLKKYADTLVTVPDLREFIRQEGERGHDPIEIMFSGPCAEMDECAAQIEREIDGIRLFRTRYPAADITILDAVSAAASKGDCVAEIARQRGIEQAEVMAVGDNHNDLPMLHYAGRPVVMANAEPELKTFGYAETLSNEESGVGAAIERYVLST